VSFKVYVGNISYKAKEENLMELFKQAGTVQSAKIIINKINGKSKGYGFVEMESAEEVQKAIEMFHNYEFMARPLIVNEARPLEPRDQSKEPSATE
jgi:RNA recognition motif-containing protein